MKKRTSVVPLRALLTLLVGLLVVVSLVLAAGNLHRNQTAYRSALLIAERNHSADSCLQSVKNFAFERGRSNVLLRAQSPINQENRRFIDARRAAADRHIGELIAELPEDFAAKGIALQGRWDVVKSLRVALERDFLRPLNERDPMLPNQWLVAANALVDTLESLLIDVSYVPGNVDASFDRLGNLRVLALQFRNLVGKESTLLAAELSSGRAPSRDQADTAKLLRGQSMQLWAQIESAATRFDNPAFATALEKVRVELFGRLRPMQDEIARATAGGQQAATGIDQYTLASVSALDSTIDVVDIVSHIAMTYTQSRLEQAGKEVTISLVSIVVILLLAAYTVLVVAWRFSRPLREIMERIDKLLRAQSGTLLVALPALGGNEFGRVQQALELLDEAMEARLRSEEALHENERINASILARIPQSIITTDVNGLITLFSPGAENMLGYAAEEVVGQQTPLLFHDAEEIRVRAGQLSKDLGIDVKAGFDVMVAVMKVSSKPDEREWTYIRKDGTRITALLTATSLRNAAGETVGFLGVATDITGRKRIENELLDSVRQQDKQNSLLNALLKTLPVGVFMVEAPSGKPLIANDAALLLLGRGILSAADKDTISQDYEAFKLPDRIPYPVDELPIVLGMQGINSHVEDLLVVRPDGTERILEVMGSPVRDGEGQVWASVVSFVDISERVQATAEIKRFAYFDHLTRLPNRRLLHDRMQVAITQARRDTARLALLLVDLDKFKPVNDNLGHRVGDLLLKVVARRMQDCLRESDTLARMGGDEFVVILPSIVSEKDALGVAEKIRLALNEPFELEGGYRVSIACSIGVAIFPEHGKDEKRLLKSADDAMYKAKETRAQRRAIVHRDFRQCFRGQSACP